MDSVSTFLPPSLQPHYHQLLAAHDRLTACFQQVEKSVQEQTKRLTRAQVTVAKLAGHVQKQQWSIKKAQFRLRLENLRARPTELLKELESDRELCLVALEDPIINGYQGLFFTYARLGDLELVQGFYRRFWTKYDIVDREHFTPLDYASQNGHDGIVNWLLDQPDSHRSFLFFLHNACRRGNLKLVEAILKRKSYREICHSSSDPLLEAVYTDSLEIVRLFLAAGANTNVCDRHTGRAPLQYAKSPGMIALLLPSCRSSVNIPDWAGVLPLASYVSKADNDPDGAKLLIEAGAKVDQKIASAAQGACKAYLDDYLRERKGPGLLDTVQIWAGLKKAAAPAEASSAQMTAETQPTGEWMPLGVYTIGQDAEQAGDSHRFLQLALNRDGTIAGTYYNSLSDQARNIVGIVDKNTQQVVLQMSDNPNSPIATTGLYNLTEPLTSIKVSFNDGTVQNWTMVKM